MARFSDKDFDASSNGKVLLAAAAEKERFAAVVFTPFLISEREDEDTLFNFMGKMKGSNVILFDTDLSPPLKKLLLDTGIDIPPCVKHNEDIGGRLAAEATLDFFVSRNKPNPTVVIFDKQQGPSARALAYQGRLQEGKGQVRPIIIPWSSIGYGREEAKDKALRELSAEKRVDAVFAGNDASALGVRDAIKELRHREPPRATNDIKIFGYDGIAEVNRLLKDPDEEFFISSVDVQISSQVHSIVSFASKLLSDKQKVRHDLGRPCDEKVPTIVHKMTWAR